MLRQLNNRRAQAIIQEHALLIFLVLGMVGAMTVYFKRGLQARINDARNFMVEDVRTRTAGSYEGNLYLQYEPYYTGTTAVIERDINTVTNLLPGATSGVFQKTFDETTTIESISETAPPRDFDLTTPVGP